MGHKTNKFLDNPLTKALIRPAIFYIGKHIRELTLLRNQNLALTILSLSLLACSHTMTIMIQ